MIASTVVGIPLSERNRAKARQASPYVSTVRSDLFSARSDLRKLADRSSTLVAVTCEVLFLAWSLPLEAAQIMCSASAVRQ